MYLKGSLILTGQLEDLTTSFDFDKQGTLVLIGHTPVDLSCLLNEVGLN